MLPIANETDDASKPLWKRSHFYSHLGLLYSTVDARAVDDYALHSEDRVLGHLYPSLLAALQEEKAWGTQSYEVDSAWKTRFSLLQKEVLSNYRNTFACQVSVMCRTSTYYDKPWESLLSFLSFTSRKYSRFRVEYAVNAKSGWIHSSNICYERKKTTFHVYFTDGRRIDIRRYGKQCTSPSSSFTRSLPLRLALQLQQGRAAHRERLLVQRHGRVHRAGVPTATHHPLRRGREPSPAETPRSTRVPQGRFRSVVSP